MSRDWNLPQLASAGLSKSAMVIFCLSGLRERERRWSGLASSEEMLETETEAALSLLGVRGICLPGYQHITLSYDW